MLSLYSTSSRGKFAILGLQIFKLSLIPSKNNQGKELMVDIKPFFGQSDETSWKEEQVVILKNVQRLHFAYFNADDTKAFIRLHREVNLPFTIPKGLRPLFPTAAPPAATSSYRPRNNLFNSVEELQMVLGMTPKIYQQIEDMKKLRYINFTTKFKHLNL
jgi:hypothetical protein